jgi:glycosyltransferase involved in cell wall biosynthesis
MKIAMIGQKGIPTRSGGVEIHVEEIAVRLVERGHEVVVYCRKNYCISKLSEYKGIRLKYISSINTKHLDAIIYSFLATIHALTKGFDIYHYHALGPCTVSWIPRLFGKKVVCTIHGLDWQRQKWGQFASAYLKFGELCCARVPHKAISVSESVQRYMKNKYNKEIEYIPNGINIPDRKEANIIKAEYNLNKNDYILFLARLVPEKGAHYLIEAYNRITAGKKLVIAGDSSHSDDYVKSLGKLAENNENIIFTGFVSGDRLAELFSNAFLYVLPSDVEGMPISLLEAMSHGLKCLVSDIDENRSVIGDYGCSFRRGNIDDLSDKLSSILDEKVKFHDSDALVNYIRGYFNWDKVVISHETVYKSV